MYVSCAHIHILRCLHSRCLKFYPRPCQCSHDIRVKHPNALLPAVASSQMPFCLHLWTTTTPSGRNDRSFHVRSTPTSWKKSSLHPNLKHLGNQILHPPLLLCLHHLCSHRLLSYLVRPFHSLIEIVFYSVALSSLLFRSRRWPRAPSPARHHWQQAVSPVSEVWWREYQRESEIFPDLRTREDISAAHDTLCSRRGAGCCTSGRTSGPI